MRRSGSSGCVRWPVPGVDGWRETSEGGTWVYAFIPVDRGQPFDLQLGNGGEIAVIVDPFVHCHGPDSTIALTMPDAITTIGSPIYPQENFEYVAGLKAGSAEQQWQACDFGADVLAAICLGTTSATFANEAGGFDCARQNLTFLGVSLLEILHDLYHREPLLVTFLDT